MLVSRRTVEGCEGRPLDRYGIDDHARLATLSLAGGWVTAGEIEDIGAWDGRR